MNVHEGPQSISKFNQMFKEGMILSNEPGFKNICLELDWKNLVYVVLKKKIYFKNLIFVPTILINFDILQKNRRDY